MDKAQSPSIERGYVGLLLNLLLSTVADGILFIAIPYWIYVKTGSAALTGAAFIVEAAPRLILTALGGALADQFSKRSILFSSTVLRIAASLGVTSQHVVHWSPIPWCL